MANNNYNPYGTSGYPYPPMTQSTPYYNSGPYPTTQNPPTRNPPSYSPQGPSMYPTVNPPNYSRPPLPQKGPYPQSPQTSGYPSYPSYGPYPSYPSYPQHGYDQPLQPQPPQYTPVVDMNIFTVKPPFQPIWEVVPNKPQHPPSEELKRRWYYPIAQSIRIEQYNQIIAWFMSIDEDKSGTLEIDELAHARYPGNIKVNAQTALRFMRIFDTSRQGHMTVYDFMALYRFLEMCYAAYNSKKGNDPKTVLRDLLQFLGFSSLTETTLVILAKVFGRDLGLNAWVACASYVLQIRAIYQDMIEEGLMKNDVNPRDCCRVIDLATLLIDS